MTKMLFDIRKAQQWLDGRKTTPDIFYASVDIRRGGGRLCPVDVNLFPAGFNNICPNDAEDVPDRMRNALEKCGAARGAAVGVIAESHTRNPYYAEHLHALVGLIRKAGYRAEASCPECADDVVVRSSSGRALPLLPIRRQGDKVIFGADYIPDLLLLNNDLAAGWPFLLKNLSQPMVPPASRGWFCRRKHVFFETYAKLAGEFCAELGMDPRTISPLSIRVRDVDFKNKSGLDRIASAVETVLGQLRHWNAQHGVTSACSPPTAVVKSNYGTYGMAVMSVTAADEILQMNRKTANKMHMGKGKIQTTEVLVQEGIPTEDSIDGCPAEPVVYLIDGRAIGAFFRHHCDRGNKYNLNVSGMSFKTVCLRNLAEDDPLACALAVARLAAISAAAEPQIPAGVRAAGTWGAGGADPAG